VRRTDSAGEDDLQKRDLLASRHCPQAAKQAARTKFAADEAKVSLYVPVYDYAAHRNSLRLNSNASFGPILKLGVLAQPSKLTAKDAVFFSGPPILSADHCSQYGQQPWRGGR